MLPAHDFDGSRRPGDGLPTGTSRLTALVEVILCSGLPTQLVVVFVLTSLGMFSSRTPELTLSGVVALSLLDAALLVSLILYFLVRSGERPAEVFLGTRPSRPEVVLGFVLVPFTVLFAVGSLYTLREIWPWLRNVPDNPIEALIDTPASAAIFVVVAIVAGGVREELQRAFILRRFEHYLGGGWLGLGIFSVAFGLGHYIQGWDSVIATALLGAFWGAIFLLRGSVVSPMISHAGFNTAQILIALSASGTV